MSPPIDQQWNRQLAVEKVSKILCCLNERTQNITTPPSFAPAASTPPNKPFRPLPGIGMSLVRRKIIQK